ncbi:MAG TPA: hypothetical protein VH583_12075 [Vicinamibacterales bacterium]
MKKFLFVTAALVAAVLIYALRLFPPQRHLSPAFSDDTVAGVVHVHTNRSDGLSSPDVVAAAAARAGLAFLIFTDHGDATRPPTPPAYMSGVLCLDGVEISTSGGHYVVIDMPPSPYPLGGEARDVVEDVHRLGGFGIVAHPDSPKPQLRWDDWSVPFDGIELVNPDTSWRVLAGEPGWTPKLHLFAALAAYPFRAPQVMSGLLQPPAALAQWAEVVRTRSVVTMAGADAHARLGLRGSDPDGDRLIIPLPGYESSFRMLSAHVRLERPFNGDASSDAAMLTKAIREGHLYTAVDALAAPSSFEFTATNASGSVGEGGTLQAGSPVALHVRSNVPEGFATIVHEGARVLARVGASQDLTVHGGADPSVYWVEVVSPVGHPPVTWIRSNPIYVRGASAPAASDKPPLAIGPDRRPLFDGRSATGWTVEHDANSLAAVDLATPAENATLRFPFGLAGGAAVGQYASLVVNLPDGMGPYDAVRFAVRAEKPMRVSLQVRDTTADRWQRSIYVDVSKQERIIALDDFRPVGTPRTVKPSLNLLRALMFVVDTTNTRPGTSGRVWLDGVELAKSVR